MHQRGWKKPTEGWCGAQGGPLQEQMPRPAELAGHSQAAPQNPPARSREQLMGTFPTPWPSPGCRGSWPLSGGRKGSRRGEEGRPGSPPRSWSLPSPKSRAEQPGRRATGSPTTPCPSCSGRGAMPEPRGSLPSAGHRLTSPLPLPGWLCAPGIPLPHPPTPPPESQLPIAVPTAPAPRGARTGRRGHRQQLLGSGTPGPKPRLPVSPLRSDDETPSAGGSTHVLGRCQARGWRGRRPNTPCALAALLFFQPFLYLSLSS